MERERAREIPLLPGDIHPHRQQQEERRDSKESHGRNYYSEKHKTRSAPGRGPPHSSTSSNAPALAALGGPLRGGPHQAAVGVGSGAGGQGMRGWETQSLHSGRGSGNGMQPQYTTNTVSGSDLELWWERQVLMEGCLQDTSRIGDPPMQTSPMQGMVSSELWSPYPPGAAPARPHLPTLPLSVAAMRRCPPGQLLSTSSQVLPCSSLS